MWLSFVTLLLVASVCQSANILCVAPTPSISHQLIPRVLVQKLAERGHNITFFTTDPFATNRTNVVQHSWHSTYKTFQDDFSFAKVKERGASTMEIIREFCRVMLATAREEMAHPAIGVLLASDVKFDVVIVEALGLAPFYALARHFKAPLIGYTTLDAPGIAHMAVGNFFHPIVHPNIILPFGEDLSLAQRMLSVFVEIYFRVYSAIYLLPEFDSLTEQYFGAEMPKTKVLVKSMDFLMFNNHPILGSVRPTVPASLALGFVHIEPTKPLPTDLADFFQQSEKGVIYFSLGSNVKSSELTKDRVKVFCEVFRKLDYQVLWKWENEELEDKPDNVKIIKWAPQQDVLAQKKVKLFITQGGQQSFEEAIYHAVPLLAIPFIADQFMNSQRIVRLGIGLKLDINTLTTESLEKTLQELLSNGSFQRNMGKLSKLAKDQPMNSVDSAVWWTEYVIRHKGAKHLHAKGKDLPLYQYLMLDIVVVILSVGCVVVKVVKRGFGWLRAGQWFWSGKNVPEKKRKAISSRQSKQKSF